MNMSREKESLQLAFCSVLCIVSALTAWHAYKFSVPLVERGIATWMDAPGLAPIVCALLLFCLALLVMIQALRNDASFDLLFNKSLPQAFRSAEARSVAVVFGILFVYRIAFPYLPYMVSTAAFLLVFFFILKTLSFRTGLLAFFVSGTLLIIFRMLFRISLP
jgi:hypothetical protein